MLKALLVVELARRPAAFFPGSFASPASTAECESTLAIGAAVAMVWLVSELQLIEKAERVCRSN